MRSFIPVIFLLSMFAGCRKEKSEKNFMDDYKGDPYMGRVSVKVVSPDGRTASDQGSSSLHFADSTSDILKMVLFGAIASDAGSAGDAGFILPGKLRSAVFIYEEGKTRFSIEPGGKITGASTSEQTSTNYTGTITTSKVDLTGTTKLLQKSPGGMDAGTVFTYNYILRRKAPAAGNPGNNDPGNGAPGNGNPGSDRECKKVVWQLRNVYNPGGGAMTMIQVPVCMD